MGKQGGCHDSHYARVEWEEGMRGLRVVTAMSDGEEVCRVPLVEGASQGCEERRGMSIDIEVHHVG